MTGDGINVVLATKPDGCPNFARADPGLKSRAKPILVLAHGDAEPQLLARTKRIARVHLSSLESAIEPRHSLLGCTVRKRIRSHKPASHLLQAVIPHRSRSLQASPHIRFIDELPFRRRVRPNSCVAVRLQLHCHRQPIPRLWIPFLRRPHLALDAHHILHMMANLMSNYIRLRKVARRAEPSQLIPKSKVEINLLVCRAIKRTGRRSRRTASGGGVM